MIEMTKYDSGEPVLIDPSVITEVNSLPAHVYELGGEWKELGARTTVTTRDGGRHVVTETLEQIKEWIS